MYGYARQRAPRLRATLFATLTLAATVSAAQQQPGQPGAIDADRVATLVAAYNHRNLGAPAWRRVRMELLNRGERVDSFTIFNAWQFTAKGARTLFFLEEPAALHGTAYLLNEPSANGADGDMQVSMHIPAGEHRVLHIGHELFDQGLLGADFSYRDLRLFLPPDAARYRAFSSDQCLGNPCIGIEGRAVGRWRRVIFHLAADGELVYGIDYYADRDDDLPGKSVRVVATARIDSVLTATEMRATQGSSRMSILTLLDFHAAADDLRPGLFEEAGLPKLAEQTMWTAGGRND